MSAPKDDRISGARIHLANRGLGEIIAVQVAQRDERARLREIAKAAEKAKSEFRQIFKQYIRMLAFVCVASFINGAVGELWGGRARSFLYWCVWPVVVLGVVIQDIRASARLNPPEKPIVLNIDGPGDFAVEVVGESSCQAALRSMSGRRTVATRKMLTTAALVLEDDDPEGGQAVRVEVQGKPVGTLDRENARLYREQLHEEGASEAKVTCRAIIVDGCDRGPEDQGSFGVKLDLPTSSHAVV